MSALEAQMLAQLFCERMLEGAAVGVALTCLVWAILRLRGRHDSRTRFAVWLLALAALTVLPFFAGPRLSGSAVPAIAGAALHSAVILSSTWAPYLFAAWAAGASLLLLRLGVGLWQLRRIRRNCSEVEFAALEPGVAEVIREFEARRGVRLCLSRELATPAAIGFRHPSIAFPAALLPQLSAAEVEIILLHEFAHLRRRDQWTNLAQKIVKAVFFFHPAVWWIESRLTLEREMACDDLVVAESANPRAYASLLISFAEKLQLVRELALTQALVSRMRQMSLRIAQILDAKRPRSSALWKPVLGAGVGLVGFVAFVAGAAPNVPPLVAFQSQPRRSQSELLQTARQRLMATGVATRRIDTHRIETKRIDTKRIETRVRQIDAARQSRPAKAAAQSAVIAAASMGQGKVAPPEQRFAAAPQPEATPAAYHPRAAASRLQQAAAPRARAVPMRVNEVRPQLRPKLQPQLQPQAGNEEMVFVVQCVQYDPASGSWTLRIWTVRSASAAERLLDSGVIPSAT